MATPGGEINLPFSKQVKDVYFHWNAGFTHFPTVRVDEEDTELLTPRLGRQCGIGVRARCSTS